jgi:hypothetical protein
MAVLSIIKGWLSLLLVVIPWQGRGRTAPLFLVVVQAQPLLDSNANSQSIAVECDLNNDPCPFQFNRQCDAITNGSNEPPRCQTGQDCYDCDPCHDFNYKSCSECVAQGCLWCPGDAFCSSAILEEPFWQRVKFIFGQDIVSQCRREATQWVTSLDACSAATDDDPTTTNVFSDPLYDAMKWAYDMIHVEEVWRQNITGAGVRIRINDNGVDDSHAEFAGKFSIEDSCDDKFRPQDYAEHVHGTAVASIAAGAANNDVCAVGIAPDASVSSCVHELRATNPNELAATLDAKLDAMDISVNAWGMMTCMRTRPSQMGYYNRRRRQQQQQDGQDDCIFDPNHPISPCRSCDFSAAHQHVDHILPSDLLGRECESAIVYYCAVNYEQDATACSEYLDLFVSCGYNTISDEQQAALARGIHQGRQGKGILYVFSSGNSYTLGVDANFDGWVNTRFTIAVAGVDQDGKHPGYSVTGAAILVAGPGGDTNYFRNNIVARPGGGCHDITVGTSFASPYVAGVLALLLQVNSDLGWRDVQGILAETSSRTDPTDESWSKNGAGLYHSYKYGFGIVHAQAAVEAAKTWINYPPEQQLLVESDLVNVSIADYDSSEAAIASSTVTINETTITTAVDGNGMELSSSGGRGLLNDFRVESVVVYLDLIHPSRGDLEIILTSPSGTQSILHPGKRPENTQLASSEERWKLMTVRNWNESPMGNWMLSFRDKRPGILSDCIDVPFEYTWVEDDDIVNGAITTCASLEYAGACVDGSAMHGFVNELVTKDNITPRDACCACGGGRRADPKDVSMLRSWRLIVYGHYTEITMVRLQKHPPPPPPPRAATWHHHLQRRFRNNKKKIPVVEVLTTSYPSWARPPLPFLLGSIAAILLDTLHLKDCT